MPTWQVQGSCYSTPLAANQAAASASAGVVSNGLHLHPASVTETEVVWDVIDLSTGVVTQRVVPMTPQPCNLLTYEDALQVGWLLIAAFVATYALRFIADTVRVHLMGPSNDT